MTAESQALQRRYFEMLMGSQFWSSETMIAHQRTQLGHLLRHARTQVPFYEHRLDKVFRSNGDIDFDRWLDIPIVRRPDLIAYREAMQPKAMPPGHHAIGTMSTSGTTGQAVTVTMSQLSMLASTAVAWRAHRWSDLDWSQTFYMRGGADQTASWPKGIPSGPWGPPWDDAARRGKSFRLRNDTQLHEQVEFMDRIGAVYASAGSSKHSRSLAVEATRLGYDIKLKAMLINSETVEDADRTAIAQAFGAKLVELYSSKEGTHMAYRCPVDANIWHVNAENLLVEILDDDGVPCLPGQTGHVIITPFFSTAQPLIRYDQGDLAVAGGPCHCGRCLPTIGAISGRVRHMFRHPDGRLISRGFPADNLAVLDAELAQYAQVAPTEYEIRYVPMNWEKVGDEKAFAKAFCEFFFPDSTIRFRRLREIPLTAAGKFLEYVYEVPGAD
ncbi:MAG: hypothetical protein ABI377_06015 [Devosia sp.]